MSLQKQMAWLCAVTLAALLSACGGGGGSDDVPSSPSSVVPARPIEKSDLEIAQSIFAGTERTPADFYKETAPAMTGYVATHHLKNIDLQSAPAADQAQFELCTDDWNEALQWSEAAASLGSAYGNLVETTEYSHYWEFGRVLTGAMEGYDRARIYKCAYLDRSGVDLRAIAGAAGAMKTLPINAADVRQLSEYLWQFTSYNNDGTVVLKSSGATVTNGLKHDLLMAKLVHAGMSASCDRIDVFTWSHVVNPQTGTVTREVETLWSFGARDNAGVVELCAS